MGNRAGQLNMPHALTTDLGQGHFHAAFFADNSAVLEPLVLAAQALMVLVWPKNLGTKKTVAFRFERSIVDRLRLFDLAIRPATDHVRRGKSDSQ